MKKAATLTRSYSEGGRRRKGFKLTIQVPIEVNGRPEILSQDSTFSSVSLQSLSQCSYASSSSTDNLGSSTSPNECIMEHANRKLIFKQDEMTVYENQEIFHTDKFSLCGFHRQGRLGGGSLGNVYHWTDGKRSIAVKQIVAALRDSRKLLFLTEYMFLLENPHPSLPRLLGAGFSDGMVQMGLEFMELGSLDRKDLQERLHNLPDCDNLIRALFSQVFIAIHFLHSHNFLHRDVKQHNMLLNAQGTVKLCDFSFVKQLQVEHGYMVPEERGRNVGTIRFFSPEKINGLNYSFPSDVWACGVALFEVSTGTPFFKSLEVFNIALDLKDDTYMNFERGRRVSQELSQLIRRMCAWDVSNRASSQELSNTSTSDGILEGKQKLMIALEGLDRLGAVGG